MQKLFDVNHPLWRMMSLLSDFMILTFIWAVFSLPILTAGPAAVAFFHVGLKLADQSGRSVIREFIETFLAKFKSTFLFGIFTLMIGGLLVGDMWFFHQKGTDLATFLLFVFIFATVLFIFVLLYAYPLLALAEWNKKELLLLSFYTAIKYLKWTVFLFIIDGALLFVTVYVAPYLVFFSVGGIAYLNGKVIKMIVKEDHVVARALDFPV